MSRMHKPDQKLPPGLQDKRSVVAIEHHITKKWLHHGYMKTRKQKAQSEDWAKCLNFLVAWGGIEPPTRGFSIRCSTN